MWNRLTGANTSHLSAWGRLPFVLGKLWAIPCLLLCLRVENPAAATEVGRAKKLKKQKKLVSSLTQRWLSRNYLGLKTKVLEICQIFCFCPFFSLPAVTLPSNLGLLVLRGFEVTSCVCRVHSPMPVRARGLLSDGVRGGWCSRSQKETQHMHLFPSYLGAPWRHRKWGWDGNI